jgi:hypothetical protein
MKYATILASIVALVASTITAQAFDTGVYYRLSTQFRGPGISLDVFNGGVKNNMTHLAPASDYSGQHWRLTPAGNDYYRLKTMSRGEDMCLDVFNGGPKNNQVHLRRCADYSGQIMALASRQWLVSADDPSSWPRYLPRHLQRRRGQQSTAPNELRQLFRPVLGVAADVEGGELNAR